MNKKSSNSITILEKIIHLQRSMSTDEQLYWTQEICADGIVGQEALLEFLINRRVIKETKINCLDGILFEALYYSKESIIQETMQSYFSNGLFKFSSQLTTDYNRLQGLLINRDFQEADSYTQVILRKLVGLKIDSSRNWLYFTDISLIPSNDLELIDLMWRIYSRDKFGFSKQRQIWLNNNCNWEKLWLRIEWKLNGVPRRYPSEFIWNINAPSGHLPLFNQIRGVQTLSALFNHVLWNK